MLCAVVVAGMLQTAGCSSPVADKPTVELQAARCALRGAAVAGPREAALCAEAFVAQQGYTTATVTDTSGLRAEFIEPGRNWSEVLAGRRGMLPSAATWVCPLSDAFLVIFPYLAGHPYAAPRLLQKGFGARAPVDTLRGPWARIVRISAALGDLKMRHSEFDDGEAVWRRNGGIEGGSLR